MVQTIGIRETWYFGLQYKTQQGIGNSSAKTKWLDNSKRISKQDVKKEQILKFDFRVKYYPEDIDEILQEKTLKLFFQQVW